MYQTFYSLQTKFANVMFLHVSVFPQGGGIPACLTDGIPACLAGLPGSVYPSMPCRFRGPHPRGSLRGLAAGSLEAHTRGGVSQHALRQTPPADSYCYILLECILVINCSHQMFFTHKIYCTQAK